MAPGGRRCGVERRRARRERAHVGLLVPLAGLAEAVAAPGDRLVVVVLERAQERRVVGVEDAREGARRGPPHDRVVVGLDVRAACPPRALASSARAMAAQQVGAGAERPAPASASGGRRPWRGSSAAVEHAATAPNTRDTLRHLHRSLSAKRQDALAAPSPHAASGQGATVAGGRRPPRLRARPLEKTRGPRQVPGARDQRACDAPRAARTSAVNRAFSRVESEHRSRTIAPSGTPAQGELARHRVRLDVVPRTGAAADDDHRLARRRASAYARRPSRPARASAP